MSGDDFRLWFEELKRVPLLKGGLHERCGPPLPFHGRRMAKIKRRDFGLTWPLQSETKVCG
jgi:hypothetical protein